MKVLKRERVVPTISASVSWLIFAMIDSGFLPCYSWLAIDSSHSPRTDLALKTFEQEVFTGNLGESGRPQGGSTITQQVVKNLLVGEDVTYERKIREIIVASRVESTLTKAEILELYLNSAYLGRSSWGVEMAARSYFGKSAEALSAVRVPSSTMTTGAALKVLAALASGDGDRDAPGSSHRNAPPGSVSLTRREGHSWPLAAILCHALGGNSQTTK
jgi:hypothetical protein